MDDLKRQLLFHLVMLWRRRWLALGIAWPICLIGWLAVAMLPSKYLATARIYVDTETLLSPLLKGIAVDVDMNQQVEVMQRTLLSRPNLQKVLRSTDLDLVARRPEQEDRLLKQLSVDTVIRPQGVHNLFTVEYTNADPVLARSVVQSLLNIFVESNLGSSRRDMNQAQRFIDERIKDYERQLKEAEQRLADFKRKNPDLTQGAATVAARLEAAKLRLVEIKGQLDDATTRRVALHAELDRVPQFLEVDTAPQVVIENGGARPNDLEARIAEVQKLLVDLSLRYTDQHPDVVSAKRMLADLLQQQQTAGDSAPKDAGPVRVAGAPRAAGKQKISNMVYEQLQLKLVEVESDVRTAERRLAEQQAEVSRIKDLSKSAPAVEAEFASLNRDYGVLRKSYDELLSRRESAKLSSSVDSDSQKVQFRIVDPPETPMVPISPNRPLLMSIVLVAGIGVGSAAALLLARMEDCFGTVQSLRDAFTLPVLGSISVNATVNRPGHRLARAATFAISGISLLLVYSGALFMHLYRTPILRFLDPVIQPLRQII
jgi:polysaccharide chain length determinant protein (PEP-CTERM system associated)